MPAPAVTTPLPASAAPDAEAPLRLDGVHRSLGSGRRRTEVLHGVDLTARAGAVTVLLGPNGAGKSTTLTLCHGSDRPDAGTVRVFGQDPWRASADLRARIGVMWQEGGLPPSITGRRFVRHVASLHRRPEAPDALLERLQVSGAADRPLRRVSGGQRQRFALAAALVGRPDLVFLDEPTAGLDPETRPVVHEVVRDLTRRGAAVVLTTHLLDDAERLADDVAILRAGRVVRAGTLAELTRVDAGDVVEAEFDPADLPAAAAWAESRAGNRPVRLDLQTGTARVAGVATPRDLARLTTEWAEHDVLPVRWERAAVSLEQLLRDTGGDAAPDSDTTPRKDRR